MNVIGRLRTLGETRTAYVARVAAGSHQKVLDVGCGTGAALSALRDPGRELWGIDIDAHSLAVARNLCPDVTFVHQSAMSLPFACETFDVVVLSEVIEHVGDPNKQLVVDEVHRVLKPSGLLIFTAPYAGLLAWTDPLDVKRRLPAFYRLYARTTGYTPQTAPEIGHKHFSLDEIRRLFENRFAIEDVQYCGLLMPFLTWTLTLGSRLHVLPRRLEELLNRFRAWESGVQYGRLLSFNVRLRARKLDARAH